MSSATLYYIHDPMCSWCWAFRPVKDQLRHSLPEGVQWENLLGGLAPDSQEPMPMKTRVMVLSHWRNIQAKFGTEFNFDFWEKCNPRRSTYPACRAVLAATEQDAEEEMIDAIQRGYYLRAMNPSSNKTLIELAGEIGLDRARFASDLNSPETRHALMMEIGKARGMGASSFPSLVLQIGTQTVRIEHDYRDTQPMLDAIAGVIRANTR